MQGQGRREREEQESRGGSRRRRGGRGGRGRNREQGITGGGQRFRQLAPGTPIDIQSLSGSRRVVEIVPAPAGGQWVAVFANDQGRPFAHLVPLFALVRDRGLTRMIPVTSTGTELTLADEAENYLGIVDAQTNIDAVFSQRAQQHARSRAAVTQAAAGVGIQPGQPMYPASAGGYRAQPTVS